MNRISMKKIQIKKKYNKINKNLILNKKFLIANIIKKVVSNKLITYKI